MLEILPITRNMNAGNNFCIAERCGLAWIFENEKLMVLIEGRKSS